MMASEKPNVGKDTVIYLTRRDSKINNFIEYDPPSAQPVEYMKISQKAADVMKYLESLPV